MVLACWNLPAPNWQFQGVFQESARSSLSAPHRPRTLPMLARSEEPKSHRSTVRFVQGQPQGSSGREPHAGFFPVPNENGQWPHRFALGWQAECQGCCGHRLDWGQVKVTYGSEPKPYHFVQASRAGGQGCNGFQHAWGQVPMLSGSEPKPHRFVPCPQAHCRG
jgi:hypothetical protein